MVHDEPRSARIVGKQTTKLGHADLQHVGTDRCVGPHDAHQFGMRGYLSETFQITGGTGSFNGVAASCGMTTGDCTLQLTAMRSVVLRDSAGAVKFMTSVGGIEGTVPRFSRGDDR